MFPDVLDSMGKTPREFGALHVHLEALHSVDVGRSVASVLLQAAFDPMPVATLRFVDPATRASLREFEVPPLDDGRVVRVRVPLRTAGELSLLGLEVTCPEPSWGATRLRPAWKLFDTLEIPKLSEMDPVDEHNMRLIAASAVVGPVLGHALVGGRARIPANNNTRVHKARELPSLLSVSVAPESARPLADVELEVVWAQGQPVPTASPVVPIPQPARAETQERRWCRTCAWEAPPGEYRSARSCPNCDAVWY